MYIFWGNVPDVSAKTTTLATVGGLEEAVAGGKAEQIEPQELAPQMNLDMDSGIEFDFVLNADAVESDLDDDSDSEMDDQDD